MTWKRGPVASPVVLVLSVALAVLGTGGCAAEAPTAADEPAGLDRSLEPGDFGGLPKPEAATPFDDPTVAGNTTLQSFRVTGSTPQQILSFYEDRLPVAGWEPSTNPSPGRAGEWRGEWARGDETLEVSAEPDTDHGSGTTVSQLDMTLTTG